MKRIAQTAKPTWFGVFTQRTQRLFRATSKVTPVSQNSPAATAQGPAIQAGKALSAQSHVLTAESERIESAFVHLGPSKIKKVETVWP